MKWTEAVVLLGLLVFVAVLILLAPKGSNNPIPPLTPELKRGADLDALRRRVEALERRNAELDQANKKLLSDFQSDLDRAGIPQLPGVK